MPLCIYIERRFQTLSRLTDDSGRVEFLRRLTCGRFHTRTSVLMRSRAHPSNGQRFHRRYFLSAAVARRHGSLALTDDVRLLDVLDGFASDFRHQGSSPFAGADIEFWIGDVYTRSEVPDEEGEAPDIVEALYLRASELRNPLELLRLTYDGVCVELTFDDATHDVDRAAVIALDFDVTALNTFFTRFHPDKAMLDDETALEEAFRTALRNPLLAGAYSQGSTSAGA